jgi:hypothetical protein
VTRAAAILALCLAAPPWCAAQEGGGAGQLALLDVPYVSQDLRLCGGAAAAMLARAAGERGIYSTDFASLVDERAGGIHSSDLETALRARGYRVRSWHGSPALARERIAAGQPVLALIEERPRQYHYVVLVGWSGGAVVYHDPARAPFVGRREADFDRAWASAQRWMLVLEAAPRSSAADAPVESAESADLSPAAKQFINGNYREAARLAGTAVEANTNDADAWKLLGASRYLLDDPGGALDAWNRAGAPTVDLVRLDGLGRTPHRRVEGLIGIQPGTPLTRTALVRAQRRVALLPSRRASRVSYVALPGNLAEVRGTVVEREPYPSRIQLAIEAARLPIDRELGASFSNLASAGDLLRAEWRFWERRPRVGVEFAFPARALPGVWSLSAAWQKESYAAAPFEERREARMGWTNWVNARARLETGAGIARSRDRAAQPILDALAEFRPLHDGLSIELGVLGAVASSRFAALSSSVRWRRDARPARLLGNATISATSSGAPRDRWPGADTGRARPLLLRAHPLLDEGRIAGPIFGRTVVHGTIEAQRDVFTKGLFSAGVATFADVARAWRRADGTSSPLHVDVGVGARLRLAPGYPTLRIDIARGLRDGDVGVTVGWRKE